MRTTSLVFVFLWAAEIGCSTALALPATPGTPSPRCGRCHVNAEAPDTRSARSLVAPQEELCGGCHSSAVVLSHPTGLTPARPLPARYPLDVQGRLTCSSCHDVHRPGDATTTTASESRGAECLECHEKQFFEPMSDRGSSLRGVAHLSTRVNDSRPRFDTYSTRCIGCHGDPRYYSGSKGLSHEWGLVGLGATGHPIGSTYANRGGAFGYRPLSLLPSEILLPEGRVGCVSCHEGYVKRHGALVISNRGSRLCFGCHDL